MNTKYIYRIAMLVIVLAVAFLIYRKGRTDERTAARNNAPDTVRVVDTLQLPAPPPKILPGRPVPFPVRDQQALDSLETVYRDSMDVLRTRLAQPFTATYEDSVQLTPLIAHPPTQEIEAWPFYKPITLPVRRIVDTVAADPTWWDMKEEVGITALLFILLGLVL